MSGKKYAILCDDVINKTSYFTQIILLQISTTMILNLSKAFDSVSHDFLLAKLVFYRVRGHSPNFFKSYLVNCTQAVSSNGESCGLFVPQGSILGPILLVIYLNDIFHFMFPTKCVCLIEAENNAVIWLAASGLKLNKDKSQKNMLSTDNRQNN